MEGTPLLGRPIVLPMTCQILRILAIKPLSRNRLCVSQLGMVNVSPARKGGKVRELGRPLGSPLLAALLTFLASAQCANGKPKGKTKAPKLLMAACSRATNNGRSSHTPADLQSSLQRCHMLPTMLQVPQLSS